ncbi:MAG: group III truncated hemoglobin [Brachymonas sp.]|jgi:hemoglobin
MSAQVEAALCTEEDITALVHQFYAKVLRDPDLGPIFNGHIDDWPHHLQKLCDFWSGVLLRSGRFSGAPMPKHAALPGLRADLFHQWLALWRETAAEQPNQEMAKVAVSGAERIAQSLWMGYQIYGQGKRVPEEL